MIRLSLRVRREHADVVLADLLELVPSGVEESDLPGGVVEYAIYGAPGELPVLPDPGPTPACPNPEADSTRSPSINHRR